MMYVYCSTHRNLCHELTPVVVETNLTFAIPYWTKRKQTNNKLFWLIK